jgi:diaminopimelate decarboxylase
MGQPPMREAGQEKNPMFIVEGMRSARGGVGLPRNRFHFHHAADGGGAETIARWSKTYRDGLPWAGITVPAAALRRPGVADGVKRGGHCVAVSSGEELTAAIEVGIAPARIVMHDDGVNAGPLRRAVLARVGRFVIGCSGQVSVLASCAETRQRVLVDVSAEDPSAIDGVLRSARLQLIGLHHRMPSMTSAVQPYADAIAELIAQMAHLRRERDVLLTRVSVSGGMALSPRPLTRRSLAALDAVMEDAIDDSCARYHFPRPVLVLSPTT